MTPDEIAALRKAHRMVGGSMEFICAHDGYTWPCQTSRLLDALDAQTARAVAADAVLAVVADWLAAQPLHDGTAAGLYGLELRAIQRDHDVYLLRGAL